MRKRNVALVAITSMLAVFILSSNALCNTYSEEFSDNTIDNHFYVFGDYEITGNELHVTSGSYYSGTDIIASEVGISFESEHVNYFEADIRAPEMENGIIGIVVQWVAPDMSGLAVHFKIVQPSNSVQASLARIIDLGISEEISRIDLGTLDIYTTQKLSLSLKEDYVILSLNGIEQRIFEGEYYEPTIIARSTGYVHGNHQGELADLNFYVDNIIAQTISYDDPSPSEFRSAFLYALHFRYDPFKFSKLPDSYYTDETETFPGKQYWDNIDNNWEVVSVAILNKISDDPVFFDAPFLSNYSEVDPVEMLFWRDLGSYGALYVNLFTAFESDRFGGPFASPGSVWEDKTYTFSVDSINFTRTIPQNTFVEMPIPSVSILGDNHPVISWDSVENADQYQVEMYRLDEFGQIFAKNPVFNMILPSNQLSYTYSGNLFEDGKKYGISIRARDLDNDGVTINGSIFYTTHSALDTPLDSINEIISYIETSDLHRGLKKRLNTDLKIIEKQLRKEKIEKAEEKLIAFINKIEHKKGKKIPAEMAGLLIQKAYQTIDKMNTVPEPPPLEYKGMVQRYYPDNYLIAVGTWGNVSSVDVIGGPNIQSTFPNHAGLSARPEIGDVYDLRINYTDGTSEEGITYTVTDINDNFAWLLSPVDGERVDSEEFQFTWQEAGGAYSRYAVIVHEITDSGETFIWAANLSNGTSSCFYNFDNTATATLMAGKSYRVYLHAYNENDNQATTVSNFHYQHDGIVRQYWGVVQHGYPDQYGIMIGFMGDIASVDVISGPNIQSTFTNHAQLTTRPNIGDTYDLRLNYIDGTSEEGFSYTITDINDNFAWIISPSDGANIDAEDFQINWQSADGTVSGYSIVMTELPANTWVWIANFNADTTSCTYNYDGTATKTLDPGKTYLIHLHSYNELNSQATSLANFHFQVGE